MRSRPTNFPDATPLDKYVAMISLKHRAIFIHIQKTGGESVTAALGGPKNSPDKHWLANELKAVTELDIWDNYFRFALVRNPWARLVSWWSMIDHRRQAFMSGVPNNRFMTAVLSRAKTFGEFLRNMDGRKSI